MAAALLLAGCAWQVTLPNAGTSTPFIITSTLAPTPIPSATLTPLPATATATIAPVIGLTTTQVNVRAQPSAGATQLGVLAPFIQIQIIGRDSSDGWYRIQYSQAPDGIGWVTAQYINVQGTTKDKIPVVGGTAATSAPNETAGPTVSGTVIQQVNVRTGPGTEFDAIGTLNPNDVVTLIGKDVGGDWLEIQYPSAPDGKGWIAGAYVQAESLEGLPIVGSSDATAPAGTPALPPPASTPTPAAALPDNDSAAAPAASAVFSSAGAHTLIFSSDVSAPQGDGQDWIQFTPFAANVQFSATCTGNGSIKTSLETKGTPLPNWPGLGCGETTQVTLTPEQVYLAEISISTSGQAQVYVDYSLRIENPG